MSAPSFPRAREPGGVIAPRPTSLDLPPDLSLDLLLALLLDLLLDPSLDCPLDSRPRGMTPDP
ncbi:MAG: hypothetical protein MUC68_12430 [Burkholderiaceae bacterium]|jgi:hypothetical protein|nr:hypothetical protein [Burkholderiaceae bacterium]